MKHNTQLRYLIYVFIFTIFAQMPYIGYIQLGYVAITTLPMIAVLIILVENNWKATTLISITWGINAWVAALLRAETVVGLWFRDPILGLFPRVIGCMLSFVVIRLLMRMSKKELIKDFRLVNKIILIISIATFIFVGTSFPTGGNHLIEVVWMTITGLIGSIFAISTYKKIDNNEGNSCTYLLGFLSGIVITIVHTAITVITVVIFVHGQDDAVNEFVHYVTRTSGVIEISVTAFTTLTIYPSLSDLLRNDPKECAICGKGY